MRLPLTVSLIALFSLFLFLPAKTILAQTADDEETQDEAQIIPESLPTGLALPKFLAAARTGNLREITELIAGGLKSASVDKTTGRTALHEAAANAHLDVIEVLLANDVKPLNLADAEGYTPLHLAVSNRHLSVITLLIDRGANINTALVASNETPLHTALKKNFIPIVRLLMNKDAQINADNKGLTPLHYAVAGGYIDIAEKLINAGADVGQVDALGNSALHYSAMSGQLDMTAFLLDRNSDPYARNQKGQTPSILASGNGYPRVLSLIRIYQSDPSLANVVFRNNVTPDISGWRTLLPPRDSDGANQDALPQLERMVTEISERYLSLIDVSIPDLLERPQLPAPLDVRQSLFESDFEFGYRAVREVGEYRNLFYRVQRKFEQDVEARNARIASLRERVVLRRNNLERMLPLFKRDALYEIMRNFRLEDPVFNARTGDLSFLLTATGALYQQRVSIRPHDSDIVEQLYNAPQRADLSVTLIVEAEHVVLGDVYIAYDDENIFKGDFVTIDASGNTVSRGRPLYINSAEIGNNVEQALSIDQVFRQQDPNLVKTATIANVRYSNNRGIPISYDDNAAQMLENFVGNDFGARLQHEEDDEPISDDVLAVN